MEYMNSNCRECKQETKQSIRVVDDRMPEYVKCLECVKCGTPTIKLIRSNNAQLPVSL